MQPLTHSRAVAQRTTALICGVFLAAGVTMAGFGPTLPYLASHGGYAIATLGWLFTALSAGGVLAQFVTGPAGDRFGQRPVLAAGMLLMSCGTLVVTLGGHFVLLLAGALLTGLGFGAVLVAGNLLVARLFPDRSAAALNGVNVFFGVGSIVGPAVAGLASAELDLPQAGLWLGAALLLLLALLVPGRSVGPRAHTPAAPVSSAPRQYGFVVLLGLFLLVYIGTEIGFGAWITVYISSSTTLSPASAALVASSFWLAMTSGRVLGTLLGLRITSYTLLMICLLGLLGGAGLLVLGVGQLALSLAGVLMIGLACGPIFPTVLSIVTSIGPASGTTTSMVLALGNCGGLIIPALLGQLLSRYGHAAAAGFILSAALVLIVLYAGVIWMNTAMVRARRAAPVGENASCELPS